MSTDTEEPPEYDWGKIPEHMRGAIVRYIEHGVPPGHFLQAVFSNDLVEAFKRADHENTRLMGEYASFLHNQCPPSCYGSRERYEAWIMLGELERRDDNA